MKTVELPPEYNNWEEVLIDKYNANKEIGRLTIKLSEAQERERRLQIERDTAIEVIRKNFGEQGVVDTLKIARAALKEVE